MSYSIFVAALFTYGVTGNTSDSGSEEARFEPWQVNQKLIVIHRNGFLFCFPMWQRRILQMCYHPPLPGP